MTANKEISFEKAMADLEEIVSNLEKGHLPLDDAMSSFEKGIDLVSRCQEQLDNAEMRIEKIMKKSEENKS